VLALLRDHLDSGLDSVGQEQSTRRRDAAAYEACASLGGADLARFERAFTRGVMAYPVREDNIFLTEKAAFGLLRRTALELGRRMASRGQITEVEDIFFLHPGEARARLAEGSSAHEVVTRRKGERAWALANEAFVWYFDRIFAVDARGSADDHTVTGIPASPGRYTGTVRVIHSEAEFDRLRPGDVLVCPATSPVWSVLFPRVGALVTDAGGILSHPAIIAREFRVPAVVATRVGTTQLQDGQVVTVDGTTGTVELLR
jgi:rifampicin phosphotransferase